MFPSCVGQLAESAQSYPPRDKIVGKVRGDKHFQFPRPQRRQGIGPIAVFGGPASPGWRQISARRKRPCESGPSIACRFGRPRRSQKRRPAGRIPSGPSCGGIARRNIAVPRRGPFPSALSRGREAATSRAPPPCGRRECRTCPTAPESIPARLAGIRCIGVRSGASAGAVVEHELHLSGQLVGQCLAKPPAVAAETAETAETPGKQPVSSSSSAGYAAGSSGRPSVRFK